MVDDTPPPAQAITFLYATDPVACRRFYAETLGLRMALDQGSCAIFEVAPGGRAYLGVCQARAGRVPGEPRREGGVVFTLVTPAVEAWHARLVAAGVEIVSPPAFSEHFQVTGFFCRDPAGYLVEFQRFEGDAWAMPPG